MIIRKFMMRQLYMAVLVCFGAVVILLQADSTAVAFTPASRISSSHAIFKKKATTSQINISTNGNDDDVYNRFIKEIENYPQRDDEQLTVLIQAIQKARLHLLSTSDEWIDDPSLIQIKRLSYKDLISGKQQEEEGDDVDVDDDNLEAAKDISMIKLKFDSCLDVIKLPTAIPEEKASSAQFLFVRPDEYVLFYYMNQNHDIVLTGNPGISKSWFQWKYILFCFRQDLYNQLKPADFIEKAEEYQSQTTKTEMRIPQRIIRTIDGTESYIFHVNRPNENVIRFEHQPTSLKHFATEDSTLLWEPGEEMTSVRFISISARIIATVSPLVDRFKEFAKNGAKMLYMPCPSMTQLRLMGLIYRENSDQFPPDEVIQERVKEYGPYIRTVLLVDDLERQDYLETQRKEIVSDASHVRYLIKSENVFFKGSKEMVAGFSHRLARFVVEPNPSTLFGGYRKKKYECSTDTVVSLIGQEIRKLDVKDWKESLVRYNAGIPAKFARTCFEELFSYYSTSVDGLKWKLCYLQERKWNDYNLKLSTRVKDITKYREMKEDTLYQPSDPLFPFVDMYYRDGQKLIAIQVTTAAKHAKAVSAYLKFRRLVGIEEDDTIVVYLHYLMLPIYVEGFEKGSLPPSSFFREKVQENAIKIERAKATIQFFAIFPPNTFEAS